MRHTTMLATLSLGVCAGLLGCNGGAESGEREYVPPSAFRDNLSPGVRDRDKAAVVDDRVDYGLALRTAAMKLVGDYPTLAEIKEISAATDPSTVFAKQVDAYMADPRFSRE